jgi:hypothetical protein
MDHPISRTKITPAPYREATLARDRLVDRLRENVHRRLTLVVADAGYGKTTLLADFSRRRHVRCLWYKLDPSDRDWVTFTSYLVAAGREAKADFGKSTAALLGQLAVGNPARDLVVESLIADFALLQDQPTALILDDYHLIDDSPDVRFIMTRLLREAPEALNVILCTRRRPDLPIGRLAARGEVHEIDTDALRFSRDETDQLFSSVYRQPLEQDVIEEIEQRTEGWAASLQLLHSSIRERTKSEIRAFVRQLSGAEGRLYDFLAEEVLRELPPAMARFLIHASLLERIVPAYVAAIFATDPEPPTIASVEGLVAEAAVLGLMAKRGEQSRSHRFHPLLRDFLQRQLTQQASPAAMRGMHGRIARTAEKDDWLTAARHYVAAGLNDDAVRILGASAVTAIGTGEWGNAADIVAKIEGSEAEPAIAVILARRDVYDGQVERGLARLDSIDLSLVTPQTRSLIRQTRSYAGWHSGNMVLLTQALRQMLDDPETPTTLRDIATIQFMMLDASQPDVLAKAVAHLNLVAARQAESGLTLFAGVSYHNAMWFEICRARYSSAIEYGHLALRQFESVTGTPRESRSTLAALALCALEMGAADDYETYEKRTLVEGARDVAASSECATLAATIGRIDRAHEIFAVVESELGPTSRSAATNVELLRAAVTVGGPSMDVQRLGSLADRTLSPPTDVGGYLQHQLALSLIELAKGDSEACLRIADAALARAERSGAVHWAARIGLVIACLRGTERELVAAAEYAATRSALSIPELAAFVGSHLLSSTALRQLLTAQVGAWPARWLPILRAEIRQAPSMAATTAAELLDEFGETGDVPLVRAFAKTYLRGSRSVEMGRNLVRRTSPRLHVGDLGKVQLVLGSRRVSVTDMRRRSASLLINLITKPNRTATREQVLTDLWPDLDPSAAVNSLNQTLYFLRRDLDPWYDDDISFNYVRNEGELVWLDAEMVRSDSWSFQEQALQTLAQAEVSTEDRMELLRRYSGRFAPEFEYEEWSLSWRPRPCDISSSRRGDAAARC